MQKAPDFEVATCLALWTLADHEEISLLSSHTPAGGASYAIAPSVLENSALLWGNVKTSMTKRLCTLEWLTKQSCTNERD